MRNIKKLTIYYHIKVLVLTVTWFKTKIKKNKEIVNIIKKKNYYLFHFKVLIVA